MHYQPSCRATIDHGGGVILAAALALLACCAMVTNAAGAVEDVMIIPRPLMVEPGQGVFALNAGVSILTDADSSTLTIIGRYLQETIKQETQLVLALKEAGPTAAITGSIRLAIDASRANLGPEGYELTVASDHIIIQANKPAGLFYGVQSLLQMVMLRPARDWSATRPKVVELPVLRMTDRPRFAWRGLLLDCSRTFLPIDYLKRCVDVCAFYKLNVLQLHLTDDQGWRLEIRKHPRLTKVGSRFDHRFPGEVSGYYSQEEIRELMGYAAERCVTIVPEIEMPSHCLGLLATYPELSCREGRDKYVIAPYLFLSDQDPNKEPKTPHGVLCAGNEKTFQVLEDVFQEVIDLFPSEYIHLAGDECSKSYWKACPKCQARMKAEGLKNEEELQSYFVKRVAKMIRARHRKVIGWDEILEGGLAPEVAVMSWRGLDGGIAAAKMGHPVVMASKSHIYFDYCYNRTPASLVYAFDPIPPELSLEQQSLVLGVEACMWTHLARTEPGIDMMIFPRVLALAEVGWTATNRRQWESFSARMNLHEPILQAKGVRCFKPNEGVALPNLSAGQDGRLWLVNSAGEIYLRKDDTWERFPGQARQVSSGPDGTIWSVSTQPAKRGYVLMRWLEGAWQPIGEDVAAVQFSAAPDGSLWAVTEAYAIYRFADGRWTNVIGLAREVSAGPDGTVWILTLDPAPGGFDLYYAHNSRWRRAVPLAAGVRIAAGPSGQLWLSRDDGSLRYFADGRWQDRPGKVSGLTVSKDGTAWALANLAEGQNAVLLKWTGQDWQNAGRAP